MERYVLPVKLTEGERQYYASWGLKKEKLILPMVIIFAVLFVSALVYQAVCIFGLYQVDYEAYKNEIMGTRGYGISFISIFATAAMFVVYGLIVKITDVLFDHIYKAPDFVKHLEITMDLHACTAVIEVIRKKTSIKKDMVNIYDLPELLNMETNCVTVEDAVYTIGNNIIENIYPEGKRRAWLERPEILPRSITEVKKIKEIVDGIMLSIEAKQKEMQWERSKGGMSK